jgi:hypothetical protein
MFSALDWQQFPRLVDLLIVLVLCQLISAVTRARTGIVAENGKLSRSIRKTKPTGAKQLGKDQAQDTTIGFVVHTFFLWQSFRLVCKSGPLEFFHYCTGAAVDDCFVVTDIVPVCFASQTLGRVRVADESNIRALEALDGWGLPLLAHVHSHPGSGADATIPSETDRRFANRLAKGGHNAIGLIFARDGHFRVFADPSIKFTLTIVGNHVQQIEQNLYRLAPVAGECLSVGLA